ncbi:glucokinase regulatory protein-like isoform X2 [Mya arenaria]|uniref:glucokinase regulatory protein-like isoform X2 n=1 Tax=Mya arenaria TaxID=6604 RepID=UPI0022E305B1|nr:glucokinase regulatory protein-like isoform X2 [Mya arenaria]
MSVTPITEASNLISEGIDVEQPTGIVSILQKCDAEIFEGYEDYKSLLHDDTVQTLENIAGHIQDILERTFNELQDFRRQPELFRYCLAGGDKALFTSQEAPEDDPNAGIEALKRASEGKTKVVYIGITCGLSAPYVAGQLDFCLDHPDRFIPVLLGFNPEKLARNNPIDKWDKTFMQVVNRLKERMDSGTTAYILNPVVGPEPITGSSRMKGGTATKVLLETVCLKALFDATHSTENMSVRSMIECYRAVCDAVYSKRDALAQVVNMAGEGLRSGGCIYYLGVDSLAIMGLIDASECPPTYGSSLDDVRGFVGAGYASLKNMEGDISPYGRHFRISLDNFDDILLTEKDIAIVINAGTEESVLTHIRGKQCKKFLLTFEHFQAKSDIFDHVFRIDMPLNVLNELIGQETTTTANQMFREIAVKWCLNAITTGAHILKGKVYKNIMIDVKVSNNKLYHRAAGILQRLGKLDHDTALEYLLRSIYDTDHVTDHIRDLPIAQHILTATPRSKIVPVALVAAVTGSSVEEARKRLDEQPVIRTAIVQALASASK